MPDFGAAPPPVDSDLAGNPDDQLLHPAVAQALGLTPSGDPGAAGGRVVLAEAARDALREGSF